ncbi:hypothetical protein ACQPZ2_22555 [Nocardia pseudovaccinii]|uniref:hypothetical protein n=1 Tax=Nocardia pseudovaccinii TaxID=189540 RepID=UPI003D8B3D78
MHVGGRNGGVDYDVGGLTGVGAVDSTESLDQCFQRCPEVYRASKETSRDTSTTYVGQVIPADAVGPVPYSGFDRGRVHRREDTITASVDRWLATLFDRTHPDHTVAALLGAQNDDDRDTQRALLRRRIADAEARLGRYLAAIEAGVDPQALVSAMNAAHTDKAADRAELHNLPYTPQLTETEIRKLIDLLGDISAVLAAVPDLTRQTSTRPYNFTYSFGPDNSLLLSGPTSGSALVSGGGIDHYANLLQHRNLLVIGK